MTIALNDLKAHLRIEHDAEDAYLTLILRMASAAAEDFCRKTFDSEPPAPVRWAVLLYAGHFYAQRENADKLAYEAMITAFHALLWPYRDESKLF